MKTEYIRVYDYIPSVVGTAVLVDRLWPRGVTKDSLGEFVWAKDLAPSDVLRKWFHDDTEKRYEEFAERYKAELVAAESQIGELLQSMTQPLVLLTAVKDVEHSHIPTLQNFLDTHF